jgi:cytochrome c oxidase subunit 2
MLDPAGPAAHAAAALWWGMLGFATLVLAVVVALWLHALRRNPPPYDADTARRVGRRWIVGGGVILPAASIVVLLAFGIPAGHRMLPLPPPGEPALAIEVIGHQWWWEVRYPQSGVVTANQLVLPVGRPVDVRVTSADVIHSFWVPRLAGKIDMLPGRVNVVRLEADHVATLRGQCAEFCGAQHARMVLAVDTVAPERFAAWLAARRDAPPLAAPGHAAAVAAFRPYCGKCHRVAGVSEGRGGPDLTDVGARPTLGAGALPHAPGALRQWLREHQRLKPGNAMPVHDWLAQDTRDAIADWLETLAP